MSSDRKHRCCPGLSLVCFFIFMWKKEFKSNVWFSLMNFQEKFIYYYLCQFQVNSVTTGNFFVMISKLPTTYFVDQTVAKPNLMLYSKWNSEPLDLLYILHNRFSIHPTNSLLYIFILHILSFKKKKKKSSDCFWCNVWPYCLTWGCFGMVLIRRPNFCHHTRTM